MNKALFIFCLFFLLAGNQSFSKDNFKIVYLADIKYASDSNWVSQIKTWGATGINLRIYRHVLENPYHSSNVAEWKKFTDCLKLLSRKPLEMDIYIRINMFFTPQAYRQHYSNDDYQQTKDGIIYSMNYNHDPTLNLSSPLAIKDRLNFFQQVIDTLNNQPKFVKKRIKLIVPTISADDETELVLARWYPETKKISSGWLTGYSRFDQIAFIQFLKNKYRSVSELNTSWGSSFSNIDLDNIKIKDFDWENGLVTYKFWPKGRQDFIDFLTSQLKGFIDTCAAMVHNKKFKFGIQLGSIYDASIEYKAFYDITPLVENIDMIICDEIAEYQPNFNFAAAYLRSACNYWMDKKRNKKGFSKINFGSETNWPGYNHIVSKELVAAWISQLESYYSNGAAILFISHWGTLDTQISWYSKADDKMKEPDLNFIVAELVKSNKLDNDGPFLSDKAYKDWRSILNKYKNSKLKTVKKDTAILISPVMVLNSETDLSNNPKMMHTHNWGEKVSSLKTFDGKNYSSTNVFEFPISSFTRPETFTGTFAGRYDIITDYMLEKSPEYVNKKYKKILMARSAHYILPGANRNLMKQEFKAKIVR